MIWPERGEEVAADEAMAGSCGGRRKARWEELGSVYHVEERRAHPGRRLRVYIARSRPPGIAYKLVQITTWRRRDKGGYKDKRI